ncbi:uncharacterized protein LOC143234822 isoform X3 [Tachypleus tridentatus]|uniref:uncharacterized protein LOC143234822 isoform X3 n=1 Tax=Tachypleus tridentatus TaxID=6853 RepID=UPI003FD3B581
MAKLRLTVQHWVSNELFADMAHRSSSGTPLNLIKNFSPSAGILSPCVLTPTFCHYNDSDMESETDQPKWQDNIDVEELHLMKPKEKKRQDVISELFRTEQTHVRNLKVLDRLFFRPLKQEQLIPSDLLQLLFPNLEEMLEIHGGFNKMMKTRHQEEPIIGDIGGMMLQMFDGSSGERLKKAASMFCCNQSIALEQLKVRQHNEEKLAQFLADAEMEPLCRRLQLKDIIATGFQRLTKYPLLIGNIVKYSEPNTDEYSNLLRAIDCTKQILAHVNQAVKEAENHHRLCELQQKMDRSGLEKVDSLLTQNYKHLDLTKHKLVHEGLLTWRLSKRLLDIHVVLLEDIVVLLQRHDDKLLLKYHNSHLMSDTKVIYSPILKVQNIFTRNVATEERGFFLVSTSEQHSIYEFVAASPSDKNLWLQHITATVENFKLKTVQASNQQMLPSLQSEKTEELEKRHKQISPSKEPTGRTNNEMESGDVLLNPECDSSRENCNSTSHTSASVPSKKSPKSPVKENQSEDSKRPRKSFEKMETYHVVDIPRLIEPWEVKISEGVVIETAKRVVTPIEKLRRKDQEIADTLSEKQEIIAHFLQLPPLNGEVGSGGEIANNLEQPKEVTELVEACMYQANRLSELLNEPLRVTGDKVVTSSVEESNGGEQTSNESPTVSRQFIHYQGVQPEKLKTVSVALNKHLTHLMAIVTEKEENQKQLRQELRASREQIYLLRKLHRHCCSLHVPSSGTNKNKPNSPVCAGSFSQGLSVQEAEIGEEKRSLTSPDIECDGDNR